MPEEDIDALCAYVRSPPNTTASNCDRERSANNESEE